VAYKFFCAAAKAVRRKSFFITRGALLGVGPEHLLEGNSLVVVQGLNAPLAVTSAGSDHEKEHWKVIGPCYIDGMLLVNANMGSGSMGEAQTLHFA
jgi:hypothetical protein